MWRLIFLVLLVWLIIYIVKRIISSKSQLPTADDVKNAENKSTTEDMVQCCTCQVHLPRSEAFLVKNKFYCSKAHIQDV